MTKCWKFEPKERPAFEELRQSLNNILNDKKVILNFSLDEIQNVIDSQLKNLNNCVISNRLSLNINQDGIYDNSITTKNKRHPE